MSELIDITPQEQEPSAGNGRKGRRGMYKRHALSQVLTEEKQQEMFTAYCSMPNYSHVARVCKVHMKTVARHAKEHNWEDRRQKIFASARTNADYTIQKATETSLNMILAMKEKLGEKIESMTKEDIDPRSLVADLERVVKLEQILLGGSSERHEHIITTHEERIRRIREAHAKALTS